MMKVRGLTTVLVLSASLLSVSGVEAGSAASGAGVYDVLPEFGVLSQFQFSKGFVGCKVSENVFLPAGVVLPSGFVVPFDLFFQMFMSSTEIDVFEVSGDEVSGHKVTIEGMMASITVLQPVDGSQPIRLREEVFFTAVGVDNVRANKNDGMPGSDSFSLMIDYTETDGLDQADLFGAMATFSGFIRNGNIVVK